MKSLLASIILISFTSLAFAGGIPYCEDEAAIIGKQMYIYANEGDRPKSVVSIFSGINDTTQTFTVKLDEEMETEESYLVTTDRYRCKEIIKIEKLSN